MLRIHPPVTLRQDGRDLAHDLVGVFFQRGITLLWRERAEGERESGCQGDVRFPQPFQIPKNDFIFRPGN